MPQTLITEEQLRHAVQTGERAHIDGAQLRKAFASEVAAVTGDSRAIDFTISTASVDRMGDTIAVDGWRLDTFRKNPVVLFAHDTSSLPVAKATSVRVEGGVLKARAEFAPRTISGFADAVYEMLKGGFLSATSVGFRPLKYAFTQDPSRQYGIDFEEQELLEFSVVPVPANAEALIEARAAGRFNPSPELRAWCERLLALPPASPASAPAAPRSADGGPMGNCGRLPGATCGMKDPQECAAHCSTPKALPGLALARRRLDLARQRAGL